MDMLLWIKRHITVIFFWVLLGFSCVSHANDQSVGKAINGTDVTRYASLLFPWQAAIAPSGFDSVNCGAVVISEYWLVTAAHCADGRRDERIIAGTSQIQDGNFSDINDDHIFVVVDKITHPQYQSRHFANDVALYRVDRSLYDVAQPITIATPEEQALADSIFAQSWVTNADSPVTTMASGWGDTLDEHYPTTLQVITLAGVPDNACVGLSIGGDYVVCADSNINGIIKDVCAGDSGGPLIWQNPQAIADSDKGIRLIGVTSNGATCSNRARDPQDQYNQLTGKYTQLATYRQWIESTIQAYENDLSFSLSDLAQQPTLTIDPFAVVEESDSDKVRTNTASGNGGAITFYGLFFAIIVLTYRLNQTRQSRLN